MNRLRLLAFSSVSIATAWLPAVGQIKLSELPSNTYQQNFDRLPAPLEQTRWDWGNDGRQSQYGMEGWYILSLAGAAGKPMTSPDAFLSAGGKLPTAVASINYGVPGSSDRAVGFRFSTKGETNARQQFMAGVVLVNDTAQPVARISISYNGEQWIKYGGNAETVQKLRVAVANLGPKFSPAKFAPHTVKPLTEIAALEFTSVDDAVGSTTHYGKKGPLHTMRRAATIVFPRAVAPGEHLLVLWLATGNGTDNGTHGLAVDDVRLQLVPAA